MRYTSRALVFVFFIPLLFLSTWFVGCGNPPSTGCSKDQDCKGERICQNQNCVDPASSKEKAADASEERASEASNEPQTEHLLPEKSLPETKEPSLPEPRQESEPLSEAAEPRPEPRAEATAEPPPESPSESPSEPLPESKPEPPPEPRPEPLVEKDPTACQSGQQRVCYTAPPKTLNIGECRAGFEVCVNNKWEACAGQVIPTPEICDGRDNDCNGQIDEAVARPCFTGVLANRGVGACKDGLQSCVNGLWGACIGQILPTSEICDGVDNNCDGQVDNAVPSPACSVPQILGVCAVGTLQCLQGKQVCVSSNTPTPEICNQLDDDCDGKTDEGLSCIPSCLSFTPTLIDFGSIQTTCGSGKKTVTVRSTCSSSHQILQLGMTGTTGPEFRHDPPSRTLPASVTSSQSLTVAVEFRPTTVGSFQGALQFNLPVTSGNFFQIDLKGTSRAAAQVTETFAFGGDSKKTDILVVIDDSCSMSTVQTAVSQSASTFFTRLTQKSVDFNLAVVTTSADNATSAGLFRGSPPILTSTTPNVIRLFASHVNVGTNGSSSEKGLEAAYRALTPPHSTGPNQGFLRPDSNLLLMFITDEGDTSTSSVSFYTSAFAALKAAPQKVRVASLSLLCSGSPCADRYGQTWQTLGGVHVPIHVSGLPSIPNINLFMQQAADLASGALPVFYLKQTPAAATISVKVNGNLLPQSATDGWVYSGVLNSITLNGSAIPAAPATVEVTFDTACLP